jgi:hypothetical protein
MEKLINVNIKAYKALVRCGALSINTARKWIKDEEDAMRKVLKNKKEK